MRTPALVVVVLASLGLPACSLCPVGFAPTAADTAAGLACHFSPEQERIYEQRLEGWHHPPPSSW